MPVSRLVMLLLSVSASPEDKTILENGGFESAAEVRPGADGPGAGLAIGENAAGSHGVVAQFGVSGSTEGYPVRSGQAGPWRGAVLRIVAVRTGPRTSIRCAQGLESGKWYRVSAWVRGGAVACSFYKYLSPE